MFSVITTSKELKKQKLEKTRCNRNKIIADDGTARFGPIYDVTVPEVMMEKEIFLCVYKSNGTIMKSENGKWNKQKICIPGDEVYVIGCHGGEQDTEVMLYKEGYPVYKRKWSKIKDNLTPARVMRATYKISSCGVFKNRTRCYQVEFGVKKGTDVWISEVWLKKQNCSIPDSFKDCRSSVCTSLNGFGCYPPQLF